MMRRLADALNGTTMYRLVLYVLAALAGWALLGAWLGRLASSAPALAMSLAVLLVVSVGTNAVLSRVFRTVSNLESASITALILVFVLAPAATPLDLAGLALAAAAAMASKYVIVRHGTHILNPAAFGAAAVGLVAGTATWWVATPWMLPAVAAGGLLVAAKVRRLAMAAIFLGTAVLCRLWLLLVGSGHGLLGAVQLADGFRTLLVSWPLVFVAGFMLTEPLTTPPTRQLQWLYAAAVGVLVALPARFGAVSMTPQLALLVGNVAAFAWSPRRRHRLSFAGMAQLAPDIVAFRFVRPPSLSFEPGQYLEWTVAHSPADARGNRRYFSPASSPHDGQVHLVMRIPRAASSYKRALLKLRPGDTVVASHAAGDFTLPKRRGGCYLFVAGGIGITPFLSIIRHALATKRRLDAVVVYAARSELDLVGLDALRAAEPLGVRTVCVPGRVLDAALLGEAVPDIRNRSCYVSGPTRMVEACQRQLAVLGIPAGRIRTDYFPGY